MRTLREIYCEQHRCTPEQFTGRVFWKTLYLHARIAAPFILWLHYDYFSPDRSLIVHAGDATSVSRVRGEVRDYFWDSSNRGWLRRMVKIRVSGERLKNLSRRYLPETAPEPGNSSRSTLASSP